MLLHLFLTDFLFQAYLFIPRSILLALQDQLEDHLDKLYYRFQKTIYVVEFVVNGHTRYYGVLYMDVLFVEYFIRLIIPIMTYKGGMADGFILMSVIYSRLTFKISFL